MDGGTKRWDLPPPATEHSLPGHLPPAVVKVLLHRGIDTVQKLQVFLEPPHRLPYDPLRLAGMDRALQRLHATLNDQELVGVFGDFDVDGVTGSAIVAEGLEAFGIRVIPYLPHRTEEGHGLSQSAVEHLVSEGVSLIITVDCGITDHTEIAYARQLGADVIVTDHHLPQSGLADAAAIINPKLDGGSYPFDALCGAGLAFKLVQGLYEFWGQPWDRSLLELAALGTIADLVPMVDENRYLVQEGLEALAQTRRPGLRALYRLARVQEDPRTPLTTETVSFQISPRLNAAGRMSHALDSYRLLTTKSPQEGESLAQKLENLNQERRRVTDEAMEHAYGQVRSRLAAGPMPDLLLVSGGAINRGVAGLVAGRLAETFQRPAVAMSVEEDYVVGSGRSIPEFDIFKAFNDCQDLFVRFGGHSQAAGFTLAKEKLPELEERLASVAANSLETKELRPSLDIDAEVELAHLAGDMPRWLATLEPFGPSNPQPLFFTRRAQVKDSTFVGRDGQHLRLQVAQGGEQWTALAFNQAGRWGDGAAMVDLVYSLSKDHWHGVERLTLRVVDFRPAEES